MSKFLILILFNNLIQFSDNISGKYYGKVTSFDDDKIVWNNECSGNYLQVNWQVDFYIEFNDMCHPPDYSLSQSPITDATPCDKQIVFAIKFKNIDQIIYASDVSCNDGIVTLNFYGNRGTKSYYLSSIESLAKRNECIKNIPLDFQIP